MLGAGAHTYLGWDAEVHQDYGSNEATKFFTSATQPIAPDLRTVAATYTSLGDSIHDDRNGATLKVAGPGDLDICSPVYVHLNPSGGHVFTDGPFTVEALDRNLTPAPAPRGITVTLHRDVFSACHSGPLFSSDRTLTIPAGSTSVPYDFTAGRDPNCNTQPIVTDLTVTKIEFVAGSPLYLDAVPTNELQISITR